jgi:hypothetical protein
LAIEDPKEPIVEYVFPVISYNLGFSFTPLIVSALTLTTLDPISLVVAAADYTYDATVVV